RFCDDPESSGILVHVPHEDRHFMYVIGIHRGKAMYEVKRSEHAARKICDTGFLLESPTDCVPCIDDFTPFIYMSDHSDILTLNTETMTFMEPLQFECALMLYKIVSVINGELTAVARIDHEDYLVSAHLPEGYQFTTAGYQEIIAKEACNQDTEDFESEFMNNFEIEEMLGEGGFGCVFRAKHAVDKCSYAVKRIPLKGSDDEVAKVLKEAITMALLSNGLERIVDFKHCWLEKPPPCWQASKDVEIMNNLGYPRKSSYRPESVFMYIQMEVQLDTIYFEINVLQLCRLQVI
ncbi:hypothetical protein PMAYCL1PPCAC_09240, partial [Pristionchus mayeri]